MNSKQKLDSSRYCPDSCDGLYGGKCIFRIDGKYNGEFKLLYEEGKLFNHYIRRDDCPFELSGNPQ